MKLFLLVAIVIALTILPIHASAVSFEAPTVPDRGEQYMPKDTESFSEGLWIILKEGIATLSPSLSEAGRICCALMAISILVSCAKYMSDSSSRTVDLIGALIISTLLLSSSNALILLGMETVKEISDYGNLLIPVLTGALTAQGGITTSTALYAGTAFFNSILSGFIANLLRPMLYIYLTLAIVNAATGETLIVKVQDFIKWISTWGLKITLYIFTGYMSITKVVSGSTDASRLKATKLTISGMVPVVGGILSDASESVIVGTGIIKNSIGVYGLLAIASLWIEPFLKIGVHYLLLKATAAVCEVFDCKSTSNLIKRFSTAMGLVLAMTGAVCLLLLVSIVCFMKGVA